MVFSNNAKWRMREVMSSLVTDFESLSELNTGKWWFRKVSSTIIPGGSKVWYLVIFFGESFELIRFLVQKNLKQDNKSNFKFQIKTFFYFIIGFSRILCIRICWKQNFFVHFEVLCSVIWNFISCSKWKPRIFEQKTLDRSQIWMKIFLVSP